MDQVPPVLASSVPAGPVLPDPLPGSPVIRLNAADNVVVARTALEAGQWVGTGLQTTGPIPRGHKLAAEPIASGAAVRKYGQIIGHARVDIAPGQHVHTDVLAMSDVALNHAFCVDAVPLPAFAAGERQSFSGYRRPDGRVGTRNYIAVASSVNCSATVCRAVADHFNHKGGLDGFKNIDGVVALTHGGGCALNTAEEGYRILTRVLAGYVTHPNVGGALLIGLGCETNQIPALMQAHGLEAGPTLQSLTIQETGGTRSTIDAAIAAIKQMLPLVDAVPRNAQPLSGLVVALECGGSDGYSGISANPALGHAADLIVRHGGTAVLAETPEIYGAEHLLTRRAARPEVAQKLLDRIAWWRDYAERGRAELNNNPSHGNKAGGLTTILEKSLGAVAKSGTAPLEAVYEYAETITQPGFVFMDTPGYDPVAVTGQVAGGCNVICFTTGRGSASGFKPAPCIKIATNTPMFERMREDMDIDCGTIVTGAEDVEAAGRRIFEAILAVASGTPTRSEQHDYGDNEFVPWQLGAVM